MRRRASSLHLLRLRHCERGAVMVEFVVVLPFLLLFLFAVVEMGRALWYHHIITNGVRDGVRYLTRVPLPDPFDRSVHQTDEFVERGKRIAMTGCPEVGCPFFVFWDDLDMSVVDVREVHHDGAFRHPNPVRIVQMQGEVPVNFWLLQFFGLDPLLTLVVFDEQRHIGE